MATFRIAVIKKQGADYVLKSYRPNPSGGWTMGPADLAVHPGGLLVWMFFDPSDKPLLFTGEAFGEDALNGLPSELPVEGNSRQDKGRAWALINAAEPGRSGAYPYSIYVGKKKDADRSLKPGDPDFDKEWEQVLPSTEGMADRPTGEIRMPP